MKRAIPAFLLRWYNRCISRRLIQKRLGGWFDVDWKGKAAAADTSEWVKVYDESWRNWRAPDLSDADRRRISDLVPQGASLLDAGCGDGDLLETLSDTVSSSWGVDLSSVALDRARKRLNAEGRFVQAFLEALPFRDRQFDVVVTAHTLEHVRDPRAAARELLRVARRRLVALVPCQSFVQYSEDYHLHYFPDERSLLQAVDINGAVCQRHTGSPGTHQYHGDLLLLTVEVS